jgi:hypothetical protein
MSHEHGDGAPHEGELPDDQHDRLLWRNNEVRKAAKDLRLNISALPEDFPTRLRVLQMVDEILALVPVLDADDEARDDQERREFAERLKTSRTAWKNRPK